MTIIDAIQQNLALWPDRIIFRFLGDGENITESLTYKELWIKATQLAKSDKLHQCKDQPVILLFNPGLDFIIALIACMLANTIPVPVYVPRPNRLDVLQAIIKDSQAKLIVTTQSLFALAEQLGIDSMILTVANINNEEICAITKPNENQIAFLQYTSGTTGTPKGVKVSHRNVLDNVEKISCQFKTTPNDIVLIWLPQYHDMGLVGGILHPLYIGIPTILMPPLHFVQQPIRWLKAVDKYSATVTGGPNFAFEQCSKRISDEQLATLNLRSLRVLFSGSEKIRYPTVQQFMQKFARCGLNSKIFYTCYGMAEATLMVAGGFLKEEISYVSKSNEDILYELKSSNDYHISCGTAVTNHTIVIVDPCSHKLLPEGEVGEIWLQGASITSGYWQKPEQPEFNAYTTDGNGPFFKTGDQGFIRQHELFVTGRYKEIIIINGKNYYPGDIEQVIETVSSSIFPAGVIAIGIEDHSTEKLVLLIEIVRTQIKKANFDELRFAINDAMSKAFMLTCADIRWVLERSLPRTSSGKLQRLKAKQYYLTNTLKELQTITLPV